MLYTISVRGEDEVYVDMDLTPDEHRTMANFVQRYEIVRKNSGAVYASHISIEPSQQVRKQT